MNKLMRLLRRCLLIPAAVLIGLRRAISRKMHRVVAAHIMVDVMVLSIVFYGISMSVFSTENSDIVSDISDDAINESIEDGEDLIEDADDPGNDAEDMGNAGNTEEASDAAGEDMGNAGNTEEVSDAAGEDMGNAGNTEEVSDAAGEDMGNAGNTEEASDAAGEDMGNAGNTEEASDTADENVQETEIIEVNDNRAVEIVEDITTDIEQDEIVHFNDPLEDKDIVVDVKEYDGTYDGAEHSIELTVTDPAYGASISYATDESGVYTPESPVFIDSGVHTVYYRITADGYNTCEGSAVVSISKRSVVILPDSSQKKEYGEEDIKPYSFYVEGLLTSDSLTGELEREIGENTGSYQFELGTLSNDNYDIILSTDAPTFDIIRKPLAKVKVVQDKESFVYDGEIHKPTITLTDGEAVLTEGTDYILSGSLDEAEAGDYIVFIEGCGNYIGFVTAEYTITVPLIEEEINSKLDANADTDTKSAGTEGETANQQDIANDSVALNDNTQMQAESSDPVPNAPVQQTTEVVSDSPVLSYNTYENTVTSKTTVTKKTKSKKSTGKSTDKTNKKADKQTVHNIADKPAANKASTVTDISESNTQDVNVGNNPKVQTGDKIPIRLLWFFMLGSAFMLLILNVIASFWEDDVD